jgi:hypothetical protein
MGATVHFAARQDAPVACDAVVLCFRADPATRRAVG